MIHAQKKGAPRGGPEFKTALPDLFLRGAGDLCRELVARRIVG